MPTQLDRWFAKQRTKYYQSERKYRKYIYLMDRYNYLGAKAKTKKTAHKYFLKYVKAQKNADKYSKKMFTYRKRLGV